MSEEIEAEPRAGLPRRDFWLLPLISFSTVLIMLIGAELCTRLVWSEHTTNTCRAQDSVLGYRYRHNCTSETKAAEGPWVTNHYNDCGYRSDMSCGPVPSGRRRVALIGTSLTEGYLVPHDDSVGVQLAADLTRSCKAPVEVQNLGGIGYSGHLLVPRMQEALGLKPEGVLLLLAPFDLEEELDDVTPVPGAHPTAAQAPPAAKQSLQQRVFGALKTSRAVLVAQHFLFRNPSIYLPLYLRYGDKADFLRPPFSAKWQTRLRNLDVLLGELSQQAHASNVRFTLGFVPQEAQVALMAGRSIPSGINPDALPAALQAMAARRDIGFVDTSQALRRTPAPERLYYQVDGHLSGRGHPIIAAYLANQMTTDTRNRFIDCNSGGASK